MLGTTSYVHKLFVKATHNCKLTAIPASLSSINCNYSLKKESNNIFFPFVSFSRKNSNRKLERVITTSNSANRNISDTSYSKGRSSLRNVKMTATSDNCVATSCFGLQVQLDKTNNYSPSGESFEAVSSKGIPDINVHTSVSLTFYNYLTNNNTR